MNTFDLPTIGLGAIAIVPIIIAICQAIKIGMPERFHKWMPFISIGLGIGIGFLADHDSADLSNTILSGVMYGLSASGLYSGVKATAESSEQAKAERTKPNH